MTFSRTPGKIDISVYYHVSPCITFMEGCQKSGPSSLTFLEGGRKKGFIRLTSVLSTMPAYLKSISIQNIRHCFFSILIQIDGLENHPFKIDEFYGTHLHANDTTAIATVKNTYTQQMFTDKSM